MTSQYWNEIFIVHLQYEVIRHIRTACEEKQLADLGRTIKCETLWIAQVHHMEVFNLQ